MDSQTAHEDPQTVRYIPDRLVRMGFSIWGEMFRELRQSRELVWALFVRDFSARYRQTILGWLWAIILPVLLTFLFAFLNSSRIIPIGETEIAYPAFAIMGLTVWYFFATGLTATSQALVLAGSMITKINFPRESLVVAAMGQAVVELLVRLLVTGVVFAIFRVIPPWTVVLVPLVLVPFFFLVLGVGLVLSLANGVFRDIGNMLPTILMIGMFATPVIYPAPTDGWFAIFCFFNPVAGFIEATRDLATRGTLTQPGALIYASMISFIIAAMGWRVFHLAEVRIAERV